MEAASFFFQDEVEGKIEIHGKTVRAGYGVECEVVQPETLKVAFDEWKSGKLLNLD